MTLIELIDRMRSYANVDENRLDDDAATDFLNEAKDTIMAGGYRLRLGEAYITTAFVENTKTINPAPTVGRVLEPTRMWYYTSGAVPSVSGEQLGQTDVQQITWGEYVEHYGSADLDSQNGFGAPSNYAIYGEDTSGNPTFYLGPIPSADRTVYMTARITFDDLEDDADENPLTVRLPRALIYKALELAATYLEQEERAPEWRKTFDEIIQREGLSHSATRRSGMNNRSMREPG